MASPVPVQTPTVPSLYQYMLQTQRFLADTAEVYVNPEDLTDYINRARREVALRTQSIRILPPVQGAVTQIQVLNGGQNYVDPVVLVSWPDAPSGQQPFPGGQRATATPVVVNGVITGVTITNGGSGYFRPQVYIVESALLDIPFEEQPWGWWPYTDAVVNAERSQALGLGYGAYANAQTQPLLQTQGFQEVYPFSAVPLDRFPGVSQIFAVKSISFIYMNYRYSIPVFSFSTYQAYVRIYPQQYLYVPTAAAQFGQGVAGSLYMYPIPSTFYQMEWDSYCLPFDLFTDDDYEAIPPPWTDAVPYFAAHLAYLGLQNLNAAQYYMALYDDMVHRYSAYARPGRQINPYGRWSAFT
jgi:hypothetical protein